MKYLLICLSLVCLSSCAQMIPGLTQAIDDAVTDEAVSVTVDKAAMQKDTDVKITIDVINKDPIPAK
jgi:hypothetical protein